jgi:quercetin dioxygenase-like cupin family protein
LDTFAHINDLSPHRIWDSAVARVVQGDRMTLAVVELEPDASVPEHRHGNEQLGIVLKGSITMTVNGEARTLEVGETYVIAGDVPHAAVVGPEGATVVDVFNPVRADWQGLERLPSSRGAWPG